MNRNYVIFFVLLAFALGAGARPSFAQAILDSSDSSGSSLPEAPLPQDRALGGNGSPQAQQSQDPKTQKQQNPPQDKRKDQKTYSPSATTGSPGHIFWVVPAFKVTYGTGFTPLTSREKFGEWAQSSYDPLGLGAGVVEAATLEYSSTDGFCGYGSGWSGYGKCFGSLELDSDVSSFIGDYALAVAFHQDPRYFRLGKGSRPKRAWYAISRVFITYNDSGHNVFYSSALSGTVIAGALSNLYYPAKEVGWSPTINRIALDLGNTALYNGAAEFWPDIHQGLHRIF